VLDNCNIHHAEAVRELVEDQACKIVRSCTGIYLIILCTVCKLVFLPPYSPDLNPIEQAFSAIKAYLRRNWKDERLSVMDRACMNITPNMAWGFFRASGYVV